MRHLNKGARRARVRQSILTDSGTLMRSLCSADNGTRLTTGYREAGRVTRRWTTFGWTRARADNVYHCERD
jgi:hypothetical protein